MGWIAFEKLQNFLNDPKLLLETKSNIVNANILPVLLIGLHEVTITDNLKTSITQREMERCMVGKSKL